MVHFGVLPPGHLRPAQISTTLTRGSPAAYYDTVLHYTYRQTGNRNAIQPSVSPAHYHSSYREATPLDHSMHGMTRYA